MTSTTSLREIQRSAALHSYGILDTPHEAEFDDLARIASEVCKTPIAVVNFVDTTRQFFKAEVGLGVRETPLDTSFCGKAILAEEILVIPDATMDPRFECNPLVTGPPGLRFYAGALLKTSDGLPIGTMCVLDFVPRELDQHQLQILKLLARQAMTQLELRRALADQKGIVEQLRAWEKQVADDHARLQNIFDQSPSFIALLRGPDHRYEMVNPAYLRLARHRDVLRRKISEVLPNTSVNDYLNLLDSVYRSGKPYRAEGTVHAVQMNPNGPITDRYVDLVFQPLCDAGDVITGILVEGVDVTDRVHQMERQRSLTELGDRLRDMGDIPQIARCAAETLAKALNAGRAGFGRVDLPQEMIDVQPDWCSPGTTSVAGSHHFRHYGSFIDDLKHGATVIIADVTEDPRTSGDVQALLGLGIRSLVNIPINEAGKLSLLVFAHFDQPRILTSGEIAFIRQVADRTQAAIAKAHAEHQQAIINQELSHRLKNTLAMVQAMASQTLRDVADQDAVEAFKKRVHALSTAHNILLDQNWSAAALQDVAVKSLTTIDRIDRFVLDGPDVLLGAKAALSLSLLLHELGTNALKYGALSVPDGHISLRWGLEQAEDGDRQLSLEWREHGGPCVEPPTGRGFG